ncbi:hypothetical protein EMCRGX_G028971 [Ephydatia muelleri]
MQRIVTYLSYVSSGTKSLLRSAEIQSILRLRWDGNRKNLAAEDVYSLLRFFSEVKVCVGNPDAGLIEQWKKRSFSLHYSGGYIVAFLDTSDPHGRCTIRHNKCHIVLSNDSRTNSVFCMLCLYRLKLLVQRSRPPQSSERKNYRYQSVPELLHTLDELKHRNRILTKYASRLKMKIEKAVEPELVCLDDEVNGYIKDTTETPQYLSNIAALPGSSFQRIFWMQQVEAAKKKKRGVRWHPLMIRWCLYLRHRSSSAYEALRNSGCIVLPSQRTLEITPTFSKSWSDFLWK